MATGILIVDKPSDWTSMDVCARLRPLLKERRIGHSGTLDPMATGVLPIFVGRATRAVEFAAQGDKEYWAKLKLGEVTDTQDRTGTVLAQHPVHVSPQEVEQVLACFRGPIAQIPPMYSAIKVQGKRLYELARKGQEVTRPPRPVTIHHLSIQSWDSPSLLQLRVVCSKGTYIRTLCHDIGSRLGCGATLYELRRTMAAGFSLEQALPLQQILSHPQPASLLLPVDSYFSSYPCVTLSPTLAQQVVYGTPFPLSGHPDGTYRLYDPSGEFLALSQLSQGVMTTIKSFFTPRT